ncbi:MAG TPA: aspartyl/asparaginyl beta-hydroxylase domain-containing protein [Candidatus Nitrosopolaris rasttigaisensis]|nr:aspartyl/asparaginyl beta-hydroxylase domain-containing protein [Candidatus Nitrosopolaris rasttigaisensis]
MTEMKNWQLGHSIEYLQQIEDEYKEYNKFSCSPWSSYKKNDIARDLGNDLAVCYEGKLVYARVAKKVKVASDITLYGDVVIGRKLPGDIVVSKLIGTTIGIQTVLDSLEYHNTWIYVWAEDKEWKSILNVNNFTYVGGKITTYGEIYGIWFRNAKTNRLFGGDRQQPIVDPVDLIGLKKIQNVSHILMDRAAFQLGELNLNFTNHYSNYNKDKSWSAISLRGYSPDIQFITKPIEMNQKWKDQHKDETYFMQDTVLFDNPFYWIKNYLEELFDGDLHRVRFMKLKPGGGELQRHTDQVDPDAGNNIGQIARFHFPIVTNDDVLFSVWDTLGNKETVNMKFGEMWLLDTRHPHMVVNGGTTERIHLVVDVQVTKKIKELILNGIE